MTSKETSFTFDWKLQNIRDCMLKKGEYMESPAFVVDAIESTKWRLRFYPREDEDETKIGYYLHREEDSSGGDIVELMYELTIIGSYGNYINGISIIKQRFSKGDSYGLGNLSTHDLRLYSIFDTLTLRCRIRKSEGQMAEEVTCTAISRIEVEWRSYKWEVKNFSTWDLDKKLNHQIMHLRNDSSQMSVDLYLSEGLNAEGRFLLDLSPRDQTIKSAIFVLFILNTSGKRADKYRELILFDPATASKKVELNLTKEKILDKRSSFLPNDTLSMIWEWRFYRGFFSEEIVLDAHGCLVSEVKTFDAQNVSGDQITPLNNFGKTVNHLYEERFLPDNNNLTLLRGFVDDVKCLHDERFLSDVKLKTETGEFPAHKFMLSASSSVFKAMFSNDMKEKINDCVHIEDLDDDTVRRLLRFLYSRYVEDLTWESASKLYTAADKYDISSLKNVCSSFLKEHFSVSNACDALLLADLHADDELKWNVQNYIIKNIKQITKTEEWKMLMKTNGTLAAETMCKAWK